MSYVAKILIVDDDPRMCGSLKVLLGNEGYEIQTTHNGQEALEALGTDDFDVVLLDLVLPDTTAAKIMDHITRQTPETYTIIITGYASWESAVESLKKGAFDYLRKPFDHGQLSRTIKNALDQKALKSERKQVQEALRKSEDRYRRITEAITDYIFTVRIADGHPVQTIHGAACVAVTGYTPEEFASEPYLWIRMVHEEDRAVVEDQAKRVVLGQDVEPIEHRIFRKDGVMRWVRNTLVPQYDLQGKLLSYDGLIHDIHERKQAEEALRESEERFRSFLDNLGDVAYEVDDSGGITYANNMAEKMTGMSLEDLLGQHFIPLFTEESQKVAAEAFEKTLNGESTEYELTFTNGTVGHFRNEPLIDEKGKIVGLFGIARDITERKRVEEALQKAHDQLERRVEERTAELVKANEHLRLQIEERKQAQEKYKTLVENSLTGIFIHQDGKYVFVNDRFAEIHGYEPEALMGMEHSILMHPDEREVLGQIAQKRLEGAPVSPQYEVRRLKKDGTTIWCKMMAACIEYAGRPAIMGNIVDITKRKRALAAVRQRDETLSGIISSMTDHMSLIDNEHTIVWANFFAKQSLGADLVGKKCYCVYQRYDKACSSCVVRKCFEDGLVHEHEREVIGENGTAMTFWCTASVAAWHSDGRPKLAVLVGRNITERKRAEEALHKRKEAFKAQTLRLEEVNTALRVLLKRREEDKAELEEKVLANVKELVLPYVEALKKTRLGAKQTAYTSIIESHLNDIVSPFLRSLSSKYFGLTPREIQVAGLVKQGKANKEIAELLSVSVRAVEFHRESIRTKLGLKHKPVNLRSFLLSFQ